MDSNPTYHHYRSAGTLFYNTQDNELLLKNQQPSFAGSVPNLANSVLDQHHNNQQLMMMHPQSILTRTESLQRRRSMSNHDVHYYGSNRIYSTISGSNGYTSTANGQQQQLPFPKAIQRHQSVREPMMSMVPEESSLTPSETTNNGQSTEQQKTKTLPMASPRKRATETLSTIKTIGAISASNEQIHKSLKMHPNPNGNFYSLPRNHQVSGRRLPKFETFREHQQDAANGEMMLNVNKKISVNNIYSKSQDSGFSSHYSPGSKLLRGEGDGEEYSRIQEKFPLEPPDVPPRDYTTDEDNLQVGDDMKPDHYGREEPGPDYDVNNPAEKSGYGYATMYKISSKPEFRTEPIGDYKVVDDYSGVSIVEKPNLVFGQSDSVMDEEEGIPMINGWSNLTKSDDKHSTLPRIWSADRGQRLVQQKSNYQQIKKMCREKGQLFEDPDFPPTTRSIYCQKRPFMQPVVWLRPHEICQRPKFISEGASRFDVELGDQSDPWLLAAVSSLTLTPKFLDRVVPPDQNFDHGYYGVFRFRFWHFGDWVEVLIDDRLPTHKGRLVFLHSTDPTEFWAALLEKAYAKLYGAYESLQSGLTTKALQDLTGGIVQSFSLNSQDRLLTYQVLSSAVPRSTLLIASISIDHKHDSKKHQRLKNGLVTKHAYSVTGLARVRGQSGDTHLVRLRNPWGKGEWNGPWSEQSWEWDSLSDRDRELLSVRVRNEGEFWMAFDDFARQFSHLDLVHIGPDDWMSEPSLQSKKPWRAVLARRRWRSGYNAGGSPSFVATTSMNPQFHIQIPRSPSVSKCHVVVSVTQQYETNTGDTKYAKRKKLHHIGFAVYEVPHHMTRLTPIYVSEHAPLDVTNHSLAREVVTFFTLPPGDYIVVPQTQVPNCDGKFLLRILTDEHSNIWEVNEDNVIARNILVEFEESFKYSESRLMLSKLMSKYPQEIDATVLQKILKGHWKAYLLEKPSFELCKSLVMLRDTNISGRLNLMEIPVLLHMLHFWRTAYLKYVPGSSGVKCSSFNLRLILWEAGINVSNKVLECLILRFAKNKVLTSEAYVIVMIRLHLAHERYLSIDSKMKENPLSLEEIILMTIYS